jgi:fructose-1,6-bisphosphatase/inositol monophosphatase family enzyme
VAHGRADAYFQTGIYIWDCAAARLICERAGGRCDILAQRGGYRMALLGTNAQPAIGAALRECMPEGLA